MHLDFMCYVPFGPFIPFNSTLVNDTASEVLGDPYNRFDIYRWWKKVRVLPPLSPPKNNVESGQAGLMGGQIEAICSVQLYYCYCITYVLYYH